MYDQNMKQNVFYNLWTYLIERSIKIAKPSVLNPVLFSLTILYLQSKEHIIVVKIIAYGNPLKYYVIVLFHINITLTRKP